MDIITGTAAAASAFNQVHNLIKALLELKVDAETIARIHTLRALVAEAQTAQLALLEQNSALIRAKDDLEKEIARLETWSHESQRYKLHEIQSGVIAYALKETHANGEPPHWLCTNCYNSGQKSFLIPGPEGEIDRKYSCQRRECGSSIFVAWRTTPTYVP